MKRPPYVYRLIIIALILTVIPIVTTHYGAVYLGIENGILLGFCVSIPCVSFACWKLFMDGWRNEDEE
jgi:heme/copper-type cytochrome/quinol oxidase subunit 4|tara:strand:- start:1333 stop:1536 length:204 start_codon:yes stop_codon:yes gene_type:complete